MRVNALCLLEIPNRVTIQCLKGSFNILEQSEVLIVLLCLLFGRTGVDSNGLATQQYVKVLQMASGLLHFFAVSEFEFKLSLICMQ